MLACWSSAGVHVTGCSSARTTCTRRSSTRSASTATASTSRRRCTGGGFGGKEEYPSVIAAHAALLAKAANRPVRMVYGRKEDIEATTKRHPARVDVATGCTKDGALVALDIALHRWTAAPT